jgi:DNA invertase Pin-like site-specific DNA recombinase
MIEARRMLREGEASALVAAKLDRLSRSIVDVVNLLSESQREGWQLVALDAPVDTSTPSGEAMASIMATFSQLERRLIGERTKAALAVKASEGVKLGRPRSVPDAVRARIARERRDGRTLQGICDRLTADGVPSGHGGRWQPNTVRRIALSLPSEPQSTVSATLGRSEPLALLPPTAEAA